MPEGEIEEVLKKHADEIMVLPGVVGIGKGELRSSPCIMVFVVEKNAEVLRNIPNSIESYPVQVKESGQFRARTGPI